MRNRKKVCLLLISVMLLFAVTVGCSVTYAASTSTSDWYIPSSYAEFAEVAGSNQEVIVRNRTQYGFAACYRNPLYVNGLEMKFTVNKQSTLESWDILSFVFSDREGWYVEANAAFSLDIEAREGNTCSIMQNIKYPGSGEQIGFVTGGIKTAKFYWDGSQKNTVKLYFKEDGLLYFDINGTEFDSSVTGLNTRRLFDLDILPNFENGQTYLSILGSITNYCSVIFQDDFISTAPAEFAPATELDGYVLVDGAVQTQNDGILRTTFRPDSIENPNYSVKNGHALSLKGIVAKVAIGIPSNATAMLYIDNESAASRGKQLRFYLKNSASDNLELKTFDGTSETSLGVFDADLNFSTTTNFSSGLVNIIELRRVSVYYRISVNGKEIADIPASLTKFLQENFADDEAYFGMETSAYAIMKIGRIFDLNQAVDTTAWKIRNSDPKTHVQNSGGKLQFFSSADGGAFSVYNTANNLWADRFGLDLRADMYEKESAPELDVVLSNQNAGWYEDEPGAAIILSFLKNGDATDVKLKVFDVATGTVNRVIATATISTFSWDYNTVNKLRFGKTYYGWDVYLADEIIVFNENDYQESLTKVAENFENSICYVQLGARGSDALSVTLERFQYLLESYMPPKGWTAGPYLVAPQWGETNGDEEIVFTSPGEGYCLQKSEGVYVDGFSMTVKASASSDITSMSICVSSGHSSWYNTSWSFGFLINYTPGVTPIDKMTMGFLSTNPTEGYNGQVLAETVDFYWYKENTLEIKLLRGEYCLYLNGKQIFKRSNQNEAKRNFDWYMKEIDEAFTQNQGQLQFFCSQGDMTFALSNIAQAKKHSVPARSNSKIQEIEGAEYKVNEQITIDLATIYSSEDNYPLTFTATIGTISGSIWTYTPTGTDDVTVTFTCFDGESYGLPSELHLKVTGGTKDRGSGCNSTIAVTDTLPALLLLTIGCGIVIFLRVKRRKHD